MKPGRIQCIVIACGCSADASKYAPGTEIICPKHYRHVDRHLKRRRAKIRRLGKRATLLGRQGVADYFERKDWELWAEAKRQAIEAAVGIG